MTLEFIIRWKKRKKSTQPKIKKKRKTEQRDETNRNSKMIDLNPIILIIILNVNGQTLQLKASDCQVGFFKNVGLQETHFIHRYTNRLKIKRWKKIYHSNINHKKAAVSIIISNKEHFRRRNITRDQGRHLRMTRLGLLKRYNSKCVST